jgi:hypothetical protein
MKNKSFIFPTMVWLWMIFLFASPVQQKTRWRGAVEEIDGVAVISNPKEPMYKNEVFHLEEELSIGDEEKGGEYILSEPIDIEVDPEGKIYVLDRRECHVKVFDKNGKYVNTIGSKGQGPGEMSGSSSFLITPQDEIAINDPSARKIHFFDRDGNFLHAVSQKNMSFFTDPKIDDEGNITASYMIMDKEITTVLKKFDSRLTEIFPVFSTVILKYPNVDPFFPQCHWDLIGEENIIWGFADKYELFIVDANGKTVKKITREYNPIKITEEEKSDIIEERFGGRKNLGSGVKMIWRSHHNPFIYLCVDDSGRIFTRTYEKASESGYYYYDVFDPDGKYMAKIPLKSRPYVIQRGKLYTIEEDEEGYQLVKRYRVAWKI